MFERKAKRKADCRANSRWSVSSCAWYAAWLDAPTSAYETMRHSERQSCRICG